MNRTRTISAPLQYLYAFLIALAMVLLIDARTNFLPPQWDAEYYVDMAQSGLIGNSNLVAPFAYRPGMPFVCGMIANYFPVSIEGAFEIVGRLSAIGLLLFIFMLGRVFTSEFRHAVLPMVLLGLSYNHIKFPLLFPTMIDIAAYPLIVLSFWALITRRPLLCLVVSTIGLLFKEFLAIPLALLYLQLGLEWWRARCAIALARWIVAVGVGICVVLIPRLMIPVGSTVQYLDVINNPSSLSQLLTLPLDESRTFNIIYAVASYWLPTLLLMTHSRFNILWAELRQLNLLLLCGAYLGLNLLLTMYGGTNIPIFVSYSVAVQVVVLTLLFRRGIGVVEIIYVILVMLFYNKIFLNVPTPALNLDDYIDFYGGWSFRVTLSTVIRFLECGVFVAIGAFVRLIVVKLSEPSRKVSDATSRDA